MIPPSCPHRIWISRFGHHVPDRVRHCNATRLWVGNGIWPRMDERVGDQLGDCIPNNRRGRAICAQIRGINYEKSCLI